MHALYLNRAIASYLKVVWPSLVAASMQQIGGSGGMLLQEKILRRSEITSEAIFGQKNSWQGGFDSCYTSTL